jgi:hypothetical protein
VQLPPAVQLLHAPPLQTLLFPHEVPSGTFPVSAQTEVPVAHDVAPVRQAFAGVQVTPAAQLPQVPPSQTLLFPHEVPSGTFPVSAQTEVPVAHDVAPVRHGLAGVQLTPALQEAQAPPLQTLFVPQEVPFAAFPVSAQTGAPVTQEVAPVRQAFAGVQAVPAVQAAQVPLLHTMLVPHDVPLETFPDSVQTGAPVSQVVMPVRHGLPLTLQVVPPVQLTQLPVEPQTLFVPQLVPAARSVPLSLQSGVPVVQVSAPWWQGFVGTQLAPSAHAPHCPARQTIPAPHEVPFGWSPDSVQTAAPVAHEIVPV